MADRAERAERLRARLRASRNRDSQPALDTRDPNPEEQPADGAADQEQQIDQDGNDQQGNHPLLHQQTSQLDIGSQSNKLSANQAGSVPSEEYEPPISTIELPKQSFEIPWLKSGHKAIISSDSGNTTRAAPEDPTILPHSRPDVQPYVDLCTNKALCCCYYCSGCQDRFDSDLRLQHDPIALEDEYDAYCERRVHRWHQDIRPNADRGDLETTPLINNRPTSGDNVPYEEVEGDEVDGIYQDISPILIPVLLQGESVSQSITAMTGRNIALSRVTQRLLREIKSDAMKHTTQIEANQTGNQEPGTNPQTQPAAAGAATGATIPPIQSIHSNLLKFIDLYENEPILKVISSPLDYSYKQVVLPEVTRIYGGQLGQWSNQEMNSNGTQALQQRLGPLPGSFQFHGSKGSLLKLFLFQIMLQEHPYMNSEERIYASLKDMFNQYSLVFEQKTIEFLAFRVQRLCAELGEFVSKILTHKQKYQGGRGGIEGPDVFYEEEYEQLQACYNEVLESVPALNEVTTSLHVLTSKVYQEWQQLKDIRKNQSFVSTPAVLRIRKLKSNFMSMSNYKEKFRRKKDGTTGENNAAGTVGGATEENIALSARHATFEESFENLDDDLLFDRNPLEGGMDGSNHQNEWDNFCSALQKLPEQMKIVQQFFLQQHEREETQKQMDAAADKKRISEGKQDDLLLVQHPSVSESDSHAQQLPEETLASKMLAKFTKHNTIIEESRARLIESQGIFPLYALQLSDNVDVMTEDHMLPSYEQRRRHLIAGLRFKLVVRINGVVVTSSMGYYSLKLPGFLIDIRQLLEIRLVKSPRDLSIDLYYKTTSSSSSISNGSSGSSSKSSGSFGLFDSMDYYLTSIRLPIPGSTVKEETSYFARRGTGGSGMRGGHGTGANSHFTHSIVPVYGGFAFTSDTFTVAKSNGGNGSYTLGRNVAAEWLSSMVSWLSGYGDSEYYQSKRMNGSLYVAVDFDPFIPEERGLSQSAAAIDGVKLTQQKLAMYPMATSSAITTTSPAAMASSSNNGVTAAVSSLAAMIGLDISEHASGGGAGGPTNPLVDFTRENDFQQLLPPIESLDINDPHNEHLLYLKSKKTVALSGGGDELGGGDCFRLQGYDYALIFEAQRVYNNPSFPTMHGVHYTMANYLAVKENLRMQLLALRWKKPYLFSGTAIAQTAASVIADAKANAPAVSASTASAKLRSRAAATSQSVDRSGGDELTPSCSIPLLEHLIKNSEIFKAIISKEVHLEDGGQWNDDVEDGDGEGGSAGGETGLFKGNQAHHVNKVTNFLARVRSSMTAMTRKRMKRNLSTSSVVLEVDYFPEFEFPAAMILERKRELKPRPNRNLLVNRSNAFSNEFLADTARLLVQVVGARNVPLRLVDVTDETAPTVAGGTIGRQTSAIGSLQSLPTSINLTAAQSGINTGGGLGNSPSGASLPLALDERKLFERRRVRSFVEIRFQDCILATIVYDGSIPLWKQSLTFPFSPPQNDFTPMSLEQIRENIYFTLFDEIIENDRDRGGFLEGEVTIRVEKYYLGSFSIPFLTLYQEGRIEGVFRMDTPLLNFGYERKTIPVAAATVPGVAASQSMARLTSSRSGALGATGTSTVGGRLASTGSTVGGTSGPAAPGVTTADGTVDANAFVANSRPITSTISALCELFSFYAEDCCPRISVTSTSCGESCCPETHIADRCKCCIDCLKWCCMTSTPSDEEKARQLAESASGNTLDALYLRRDAIALQTKAELSYFVSDDQTTYMKVMLMFNPMLPKASLVMEELSPYSVMKDDRLLAIHYKSWLDGIHAIDEFMKERPIKAFAMNSQGLNVFLCRYLLPQAPPPGYHSRRACLHLVSQIPFMKDSQAFIGSLDLWCTSQQFWEIGAGDEEEHAVLLYNYFKYLLGNGGPTTATSGANSDNNNVHTRGSTYPSEEIIRNENVFLVLGKAIPEGETVYLLVRDYNAIAANAAFIAAASTPAGAAALRSSRSFAGSLTANIDNGTMGGEYLVINPCSGHIYSTTDPYCPLKEIYCMATPYNLWANTQYTTAPHSMSFDVLNTDCWRPFFGAKFPPVLGGLISVQDSVLSYSPTNTLYCEEIEKAIHQALRNAFRRWRSKRHRSKTTFHPEACSIMLECLPQLEEWKKNGDQSNVRVSTIPGAMNFGGSNANSNKETGLDHIEQHIREKLRVVLRNRVLRGFPLNIPFTDVDEVVAKIKTLCVHEANHPDVQFVLAVKVFPLFNGVVSLWVYIGSLEAKTTAPASRY